MIDMRGELWQECDVCGAEPVCSECMMCERHCSCDVKKGAGRDTLTAAQVKIAEYMPSIRMFNVTFRYDPSIVSAIKAIPGREWHPATLSWHVPSEGKNVLERLGFNVIGYVPPPPTAVTMPVRSSRIATYERSSNLFVLKFPFDYNTISLIKSIHGRIYNPSTKTWTVPGNAYKNLQKIGFEIVGYDVPVIDDKPVEKTPKIKKPAAVKKTRTSNKFVFRNVEYSIPDVISSVKEFVASSRAKSIYEEELAKHLKKIPVHTEQEIKMYGKEYFDDERARLTKAARIAASTAVLNVAFGKVIGGGCMSNQHAPEHLSDIDENVIKLTLERIRALRMQTVHRNYRR